MRDKQKGRKKHLRSYDGSPVASPKKMEVYAHREGLLQTDLVSSLHLSNPTLSQKMRNGNWTMKEFVALIHLLQLTDSEVLDFIKPNKHYLEFISGWIDEGKQEQEKYRKQKRRNGVKKYNINLKDFVNMKKETREIYRRNK